MCREHDVFLVLIISHKRLNCGTFPAVFKEKKFDPFKMGTKQYKQYLNSTPVLQNRHFDTDSG